MKVNVGDLKIPITFFEENDADTPEPNVVGKKEAFSALCFPYSPSVKDHQILNANGIKQGVTIVMPDTRGQFIPTIAMTAVISDYRYLGIEWNVIEVRPDFENNSFVTVVLGAMQ